MDIAKYIGLFLLKNNFCYIPGIGNLELKKKPASHNGQALQAPVYEIILSPIGSIDDSLANFIATNEKISIANASNAIRNFATESKAALNQRQTVIIPSLGYFVDHSGKIQFHTDANFSYTPQPIPTIKTATRAEEPAAAQTDTYYERSGTTTNWGKIILVVVLALVIIGGIVAAIMYMSNRPSVEPTAATQPVLTATEADSIPTIDNATQPTPGNAGGQYKVILNTYHSKNKAEARHSKLTSFGNTVEIVEQDSNTFHVVIAITVSPADTAHVLDSLKGLFNPNGVSIYHQ